MVKVMKQMLVPSLTQQCGLFFVADESGARLFVMGSYESGVGLAL